MTPSFALYRVDYMPDAAEGVASYLKTRFSSEASTAGLSQPDVVQLVTDLAWLRDSVTARRRVAIYDADSKFLGVVRVGQKIPKSAVKQLPILGEGPLWNLPPGPGLPKRWGAELALAIDQVTRRIGELPQGPEPVASEATVKPANVLVMAVIVAGIAATVIGAVAPWRYFDPDLAKLTVGVRQAASDFAQRLKQQASSGTLPDPSPTELAVADMIKNAAGKEKGKGWAWGAGIGGGLVGATVGIAAVTR
jgi:hypothetical protein